MSNSFHFLFAILFFILSISCTQSESQWQDSLIDENELSEVLPTTIFEMESYRRASQYASLKWTPKNPIPSQGGKMYFPAGKERTGMLYAEGAFQDKRVGYDVSLYTFMTALNNPYSLLYTENVRGIHSKSAYGITYHGDSNSGAYMGVACNSFVYMVLGSMIPFSSYETSGFVEEGGIVTKVNERSSQALHLLDLLQTPGHIRIVTNLWKDKNGFIKKIIVAEAVGSGVRFVEYNSNTFDEWLVKSHYSIFRFSEDYSVGDVSPMPAADKNITTSSSLMYNKDICTFAGDCASFGENDLIVINYIKGTYDAMEIFRNNLLIDTIELDDDSNQHELNISGRGYGPGEYKARLLGQESYSDYTHWEVIGVELQITGNCITFSCPNGKPLYWGLYNEEGWASWKKQITIDEVESSQIIIDNYKKSYPIFKLYVQGKYGRIAPKLRLED